MAAMQAPVTELGKCPDVWVAVTDDTASSPSWKAWVRTCFWSWYWTHVSWSVPGRYSQSFSCFDCSVL